MYELVPTDPLDKLKTKATELEKEIEAIKEVLKDTVSISKLHASSEELVGNLVDMIKVNQEMVEAVSKSNKEIGSQINKSIQQMNESNKELSQKLDALLEFFAEAGEKEEIEKTEISEDLKKVLDELSTKIDEISDSNRKLSERMAVLEGKIEEMGKRRIHRPLPPPIPSVTEQKPAPPPLKTEEK